MSMVRSNFPYPRPPSFSLLGKRKPRWNPNMRKARARFQSRTAQRRARMGNSGLGVTTQHDSRLIYRKRRMPRYKKARWRRFKNRVLAVSEKDLGSQQVIFNNVFAPFNATPGNQLVYDISLYGLKSTNSRHNDLNNISGFLANAVTTPTTGLTVDSSAKVLFQSAVLDLTIRNASTFTQSDGSVVFASATRMEVDIYECIMTHSAEETGTTYNNLMDIFAENKARTGPIGGGATTEVDYVLRGVTPFDLSYSLSRFGVKITKKTKYTISNNDQITYQMRDPRRYSVVNREMVNQDGFNRPRMTKIVFIVGKLSPGLTIGSSATPGNYNEVLQIGCTRKYFFKIENYTEDRTAYLVA